MLNWLPSLLLYASMNRNERTAPNTSTDSSFYFYFYFLPPLCSSVFSPLFCIIVGFIFISLLLSFFSFVSPPRSQPTRRSQLVDRKCLSLSFSVCSRSSLNPTCPTDIVSTSSDAVPRPAKKRQTTLKGETQKQTKNKIEKSIRIVFIFYFFSSIRWLQQVISSTTAHFSLWYLTGTRTMHSVIINPWHIIGIGIAIYYKSIEREVYFTSRFCWSWTWRTWRIPSHCLRPEGRPVSKGHPDNRETSDWLVWGAIAVK